MMGEEITVVCWKWHQRQYRSRFTPEHVRVLRNMVKRHLHLPHRFMCITDNPKSIDPSIETMKLWDEPSGICLPINRPNCYRRLRAFAPDAKDWLGDRILSIDLDTVILDDITHLVDIPDDFKIWGDTAKNTHYNGGFWLLRAGTRARVWEAFDHNAPEITRAKRMVGSDQAWISHILGPNEKKWSTTDGVYSFRNHMSSGKKPLPSDARIVFFHGQFDPWDPMVQRDNPWIREHYR